MSFLLVTNYSGYWFCLVMMCISRVDVMRAMVYEISGCELGSIFKSVFERLFIPLFELIE